MKLATISLLVLLPVSLAHARGGEVRGELACPVDEPMGLAIDGEHLWISDMATRTLVKISKSDGSVAQRLEAPGLMPSGLSLHAGVLYAADRRRNAIERRRPENERDLSPLPYFERWAWGITHDGTHLWVVDARASKIHQLDPADGTTIRSFAAPAKRPTGIAFDGQYLWVADHQEDQLYLVDRMDGAVILLIPSPGPYPSALAVDGDEIWVADYQERRLYRVARPDDTPYVEDDERRVHATYDVIYRADGGGRIEDLTAHLALPRNIPGQHLQGELSFSPEPTRIATDRWGQRVAIFELGTLESGASTRVHWEGDFALFRVRFHLLPERVQAATLPGALDTFLADDKKYDLFSPTIRDLVAGITKKETAYYWRARAIYDHLTEVITYDRSGGWNNAATVLERGTGSCSEYTFALVALLRRAGIPARYVGAISERGNEASFDDVFHRWAEAYFPGYGWVPLDANAGHGELPGAKGSFFGGRSNRHVVTTIGGGASEYLDWTYNHHVTYHGVGRASLEVLPIARYRPLAKEGEVEPLEAPRVLAPTLTAAVRTGRSIDDGKPKGTSPWLVGLVVLVALGVGVFVGRTRRPG